MAILRRIGWGAPGLVLSGDLVTLRAPVMADFAAWSGLRRQSQAFLAPWEPLWPQDDLTRAAFRRRVRLAHVELAAGTACRLLIFRSATGALAGGLTLSQIRRGSALAATLGYWTGESFARQGLMTDAVRTVQRHAFGTLGLRRLEAACLPHNVASIRLLEKTGFRREGYAREYLQIAGRWHDHLLYGVLAGDVAWR